MTDIGAELLSLLDFPVEWEYAATCEGMRHTQTGILITPSLVDRVVVHAGGESRTAVLDAQDHSALWMKVFPLVEENRAKCVEQSRAAMRKLLGIEPQ